MFFKLATTDLEGNTVLYKYVVVEWLSFLSDGLPNEHVFAKSCVILATAEKLASRGVS